MKKFVIVGGCALMWALASTSSAPAWVNFKFGAGINWNWQAGGNNLLWGLFRNGQPPGYEYAAYPGPGHPGMPYPYPGPAFPGHGPMYPGPAYQPGPSPFPGIHYYGPQEFQFFGNQGITPGNAAPQGFAPAPTTQSAVTQNVPASAGGQFSFMPVSHYPGYYYSTSQYPYYTLDPAFGSWNNPTYWNR